MDELCEREQRGYEVIAGGCDREALRPCAAVAADLLRSMDRQAAQRQTISRPGPHFTRRIAGPPRAWLELLLLRLALPLLPSKVAFPERADQPPIDIGEAVFLGHVD